MGTSPLLTTRTVSSLPSAPKSAQMPESPSRTVKTADNNVLKNCLDKDLMLAKALKAGVKTLQNQTVHELEFTNIDNQATGQVLAQAFGQFNAIRTGIQGNNN